MRIRRVVCRNAPAIRAALVACCLMAMAAPASAQTRRPPVPPPAPDFLFATPAGSFSFRGDWLFSRAGSDWYDFVTDQLTLEREDFRAPGFTIEGGVAVGSRGEVLFGLDLATSETRSEYRNFVDNRRLPIEQDTRLRTLNLMGSFKYAVTDRGLAVSRLAWVPRRVVPYVGAGGGFLRYDMSQIGDFVDFADRSVFSDHFRSSGWTPSAHVLGGVDVRVFRRLYVTIDGRYRWASADLDRDWIDFDPIDLAGLKLSAGINVVF